MYEKNIFIVPDLVQVLRTGTQIKIFSTETILVLVLRTGAILLNMPLIKLPISVVITNFSLASYCEIPK